METKGKLYRVLFAILELFIWAGVFYGVFYASISLRLQAGVIWWVLIDALLPLSVTLIIIRLIPNKYLRDKRFFYAITTLFGVLAFIVLILPPRSSDSPETRRLADIRTFASALDMYQNDFHDYPGSLQDLTPTYIGMLPPPRRSDPGSACKSKESTQYIYRRISDTSYTLRFCLGSDTGGYSEGTHWLTEKGIQ